MAPKGGNAKKESGRAKKAENEAKKQASAEQEKERKEANKWEQGAKGKNVKDEKEAKRKEAAAAKAERDRLLAEEEAAAPSKPKAAPKAGAKKKATATAAVKPTTSSSAAPSNDIPTSLDEGLVESFAASGIDDTIDLLGVINAKSDKASKGSQAAGIEKHPERRFKAAFEAYKERELQNVKSEHPGLRLNQYQELLFKRFQKSPENPFNQVTVAYDASKDERLQVLESRNNAIKERLRDSTD